MSLMCYMLKWSTDSDINLTVVCRHRWRLFHFSWWRPQCRLKASNIYLCSSSSICSSDVYGQQSVWCRYLYSILTHFLAFNLSRFSFYINNVSYMIPKFVSVSFWCFSLPKLCSFCILIFYLPAMLPVVAELLGEACSSPRGVLSKGIRVE